jgi:hypothetical protein
VVSKLSTYIYRTIFAYIYYMNTVLHKVQFLRKEIKLEPEIILLLQAKAAKEKRSLKNYMGTVLIDHAKIPEKEYLYLK